MFDRTKHAAVRAIGVAGTVAAFVLLSAGQSQALTPIVQVSSDPYTNTTSYHRTQVEPDDFAFGSTIVSTFQSGRFFDGGASNIGWATSTDLGAHWTDGSLPGTTVYATPAGTYARISDPSVAYDPKHSVWMISGLAIDANGTGKAVLVNRSTDGGLTWQNPVTVSVAGGSSFYDKEWISCDTNSASPFFGNCYAEWDDNGSGNKLKLWRSTDGGLTWSASTTPSELGVIGGQPLAQPNGTVVVPIGGGPGLESFVSADGGATYTGPFTIASVSSHGVGGGLRDGEGLPSAEVDGSGTIYVVWQDCRFRAACAENDIVMSTSTDGKNWAAVTRIPIDATTSTVDHFIPGIGVDRSTSGASAHLAVTYYYYPVASCGTNRCKLTVGYVSSTNGGSTWHAPLKLAGPISLRGIADTNQGFMVGDYISTAIAAGKAFPVVASATGNACTLGQITSCNEFAASSTGLPVRGGVLSGARDRPVTSGHNPNAIIGRTAF